MSAPDITPFLEEADRRRPDLKGTNTAETCFKLLQLTLALAGPDWAFVGKTSDMDGASVHPNGFTPLTMSLMRPDGQQQTVTITGLSMDAAWHVPTHRQVKVIANSSANDDPDVNIHGPARLTPYPIDPQNYRWHNPPIPQFGSVSVPPMPETKPPAPPAPAFPSYEDLGGDAFFRAMVGVPLEADMLAAGQRLNDGSAVWFSRTVYRLMAAFLKANGKPIDAAGEVRTVRNEWRSILGLPAV